MVVAQFTTTIYGVFFMVIKSTLEQLEEVQAAISRVMSGQEVAGPNGRRLRLADLPALEAREEKLLARYHREQAGNGLASTTACRGGIDVGRRQAGSNTWTPLPRPGQSWGRPFSINFRDLL